ncbi:N-acetylmuramoyl-L-alanine amidase [gut metagenome]|uniref:N-acetylmuramoyl-L-alanine amidase n=1 Tax=gut metagenome TaxID=749906 RepID=J9CL98_9ZZZZ
MIRIHFFICFIFFFLTFSFAQEQSATPQLGEGITTFLERHGRPSRTYYQDFLKMNKQKLHGKKELRMGVKYLLPPLHDEKSTGREISNDSKSVASTKQKQSFRTFREPLFGKELADVKPVGERLKGACFYVVSGHGGPDPGAIGRVGRKKLHEDEYAYDVALRLARQLMLEGAEVRMIIQDAKDGIREDPYLKNSKRETCMGSAIPLNQTARLQQRCTVINNLYRKDRQRFSYCRAIFLHVDSRSKGAQTDVFFYHAPKSVQGERLAGTMKRTFESKYGRHQPSRGFRGTVSERNLYVLLNATPVALFVELGNIQNTFDQRRFVMSSNREALARWMKDGFVTDSRRFLK